MHARITRFRSHEEHILSNHLGFEEHNKDATFHDFLVV